MSAPTTTCGLLWSTGDAMTGPDIASGFDDWEPGDWVQVLTAVPDGCVLVEMFTSNLPVASAVNNQESVLEAGWGVSTDHICLIAGWPVSIGTPAPSAWDLMLPVPRTIPPGSNVYLRYRGAGPGIVTLLNVAVGYYIGYDSTHQTGLAFYRDPGDADGTLVSLPGVSWTFSSWVEVSAGPSSDAYLAGLSILPSNISDIYTDTEFEIGVGAGPDSLGTITVQAVGGGSFDVGWLPRVMPVLSGVPISVRMRSATTITAGALVAPLYYANPEAGCGTSTIIVVKDNTVTGDTTAFNFGTNGGQLTPDSFDLADGESQTFIVSPGSGYAIIENAPENWVVTYDVSNGSPISNITVADDEVVIVTAHNIFNPPSILYADRRLRQFAIPTDENKWIFLRRLELEFQRGEGLSDGQGSDPQIMLSISRDGGKTWGPEIWTSAGKQGEFQRRAIWRQLGRARNPVVRIVVTDPVFWSFQAAYFEGEPGTS